MKYFFLGLFSLILIFGCNNPEKKKVEEKKIEVKKEESRSDAGWNKLSKAIVSFNSYDGKRILEQGQGFFVEKDLLVTRYSMVKHADNIVFSSLNKSKKYRCRHYVAVDRINDIILLKTDSIITEPIKLFNGKAPDSAKTMYVSLLQGGKIQLFTGKLLNLATIKGGKLYRITNKIRKSVYGAPVFVSNKKAIGIAFADVVDFRMQSLVIPSTFIIKLMEKKRDKPKTLNSLRSGSDESIADENKKIKGLVLHTDLGDITIRLFNETPQYRDNFVKLAKEQYYDSLLIHRVIRDLGIQSGAADTRYAEKGDVVGWKGPGYTLPAHIIPNFYHKRGMIGVPRKPDSQNRRQRSDGSQFYIVSGRKYSDRGLDDIEKENNYKFSEEQRQVYKTIGGAPYLDGSYTVFGEVIKGMGVVDSIVMREVDRQWRPKNDIWLRKVTILK